MKHPVGKLKLYIPKFPLILVLGLAGTLGVSLYIEIVDSEGDSRGRRNQSTRGPEQQP